jgi:cell division protein FtsI (penicillin-binding protein 3)
VAANSPRNSVQLRLYLLGGILLVWFAAIAFRLVNLQIFQYGEFEARAQHQQQRTVEISAKRGIIYDRAGHELAMSINVDSGFAVPSEIPDLATTISLITRITKEDPREILAKCKASHSFCWVARKADAETAERIKALNLKGIYFEKEAKRFYPKRELAAQVLGYVGMDDEGLSGIEREYDGRLHGKPGRILIQVDARRKNFDRVEKPPDPGENVILTIDQNVQYIAEKELEAAMSQTHAAAGTVIIEDPRTGEILALANRPTFNPNLSRHIRPESLEDRAVSDVYEPGSTFKLVTLSAALDEHLTSPNELIDCQMGSIVINGRRIHDWKPFGVMPVSDVLAWSSDVGAIKVGLKLGDERLYKYIRAYGFGQQTGIELPAETRGLAKPLSRWSKVSIGAIAMGQEIGVSPVQLAAMVSTIANDGVWVAPRIVATTTRPRSTPQMVLFQPQVERRVLSPMTAAQMKQMMQGVVLHGTGRKTVLAGYSSGGKSGTAQKVDPATGTYSRSKYIASFAGFAPTNNPAITLAVILDSPVGSHHGGVVAGPVFQRIAQQVLEYLHIPHDVEFGKSRELWLAAQRVKKEDLEEGSPDHLGDTLEVASANDSRASSVVGSATVGMGTDVLPAGLRTRSEKWDSAQAQLKSSQPPTPAIPDKPASGTVVLDVEQGGIIVPSFVGKTVRSAIEQAEASGLEVDAVGSGIARDQSPPAGAHVVAGAMVVIKFER